MGLENQPIHLVGLSMGGSIAMCYAAAYPDHVKGVSLLGPARKMTWYHIKNFPCILQPENVVPLCSYWQTEHFWTLQFICVSVKTPTPSKMVEQLREGMVGCLIDFTEDGIRRRVSMATFNSPKLPGQVQSTFWLRCLQCWISQKSVNL